MNSEFSKNSIGRSDNAEEVLLSPAEAVRAIEAGVDLNSVLARLDVDACHFTKRVDDEGEEPLITTGFPCYTAPSKGVLAFSVEEMKRQQAKGEKSILVVDHKLLEKNCRSNTDSFKDADGLIILSHTEDDLEKARYNHFLVGVSNYSSVLLDNPTKPQIKLSDDGKGIELANGDTLREGNSITIDPMSGKLWREELSLLLPDKNAQILVKLLKDLGLSAEPAQVAFHDQHYSDLSKIYDIRCKFDKKLPIGLHRTDLSCLKLLRKGGESSFVDLSKGAVPICLAFWDNKILRSDQNYRLPDIHNMLDVLPDEFREALKNGDDHKIGTPLFRARDTLYRHQLETAFREGRQFVDGGEVHIIIPSVKTAEEVKHFKKMVEEITPPELKGQIKFGVMMETKEALKNTREIARQCDCLCYGTNGLTESYTGLDRSKLDHSEYMIENDLEGISPYDRLVPEVADPMARSLAIVREVEREQNREIITNSCGHQTGGHHMGSIKAVLDMGIRQLTVPPNEEHYHRTQLAIAQHAARRKLACTPTPEVQGDLELAL